MSSVPYYFNAFVKILKVAQIRLILDQEHQQVTWLCDALKFTRVTSILMQYNLLECTYGKSGR